MSTGSFIPLPVTPRRPSSNKNKSLPPLPPPVFKFPATPPRRNLDLPQPRSVSYAAPTRSSPLPIVKGRDTSFDMLLLRPRPKIGFLSSSPKKKRDVKEKPPIDGLIDTVATKITDDGAELLSCHWWTGRYMGISDRLRWEFPGTGIEERDAIAYQEMYALCLEDDDKLDALGEWWREYKAQRDKEGPSIKKAFV